MTAEGHADPVERLIPKTATKGRRTPVFSATNTPAALLADHVATTWAQLEVESGTVTFVEEGPPALELVATTADHVIIVPNRPHRVEPSHDARFAVQFFDVP